MEQIVGFLQWWFDGSVEAVVLAALFTYGVWKLTLWLLPDWLCGPGGIWIDTHCDTSFESEGGWDCGGGDGGGGD